MRNLLRLAMVAIGLLSGFHANAWGPEGHAFSGAIADALLNEKARSEVKKILGIPLKTAATWTDCVKDVKEFRGKFWYYPDPKYHKSCQAFETDAGKARMVDYVSRNWSSCRTGPNTKECHKEYHYADVAIEHGRYDRAYTGTSDHDIVGAINAAVAVLQGRSAPAPFSIKDKPEALFLLAHLVGDLHQPLHVGAIYLDSHDHAVDPDAHQGAHDPATDTRGGNLIDVGSSNLHADWDKILASLHADAVDPKVITAANAIPRTSGPVADWAAKWATDTVTQSHKAFHGITYTHPGTKGKWKAQFDDRRKYSASKRQLQLVQLEKAGARLAELLNTVLK